ncbi:MAG: hypothetical protein L0H25_07690 [Micrococcales bacterium]|nr:hypothetical protein [Micrococcales bacterium]
MNEDVSHPPVSAGRSTLTMSPSKPVSTVRAATVLMIGIVALAFTAPWVKVANFEPATSVLLRVAIAIPVLLPFALRERATRGGVNRAGTILALVAGFFLGLDFTAWN